MSKKYKVTKLSTCMAGFNVGDIVIVSNFNSQGTYSHEIKKYEYLEGEYYKLTGYCDLDHIEPIKEEEDNYDAYATIKGEPVLGLNSISYIKDDVKKHKISIDIEFNQPNDSDPSEVVKSLIETMLDELYEFPEGFPSLSVISSIGKLRLSWKHTD